MDFLIRSMITSTNEACPQLTTGACSALQQTSTIVEHGVDGQRSVPFFRD
jgi:hypothetical protein